MFENKLPETLIGNGDLVKFKKDDNKIYKVGATNNSRWEGTQHLLFEYPVAPDGLGIGWQKVDDLVKLSEAEKDVLKYKI